MATYSEGEMWTHLWGLRNGYRLRPNICAMDKIHLIDPEDLFMETLTVCIKYRNRFKAGTNLCGWVHSANEIPG